MTFWDEPARRCAITVPNACFCSVLLRKSLKLLPGFRSTKRVSPRTTSNNNFGFFLAFFPEPTHLRKPKLSSLCSILLNSKRRSKKKEKAEDD